MIHVNLYSQLDWHLGHTPTHCRNAGLLRPTFTTWRPAFVVRDATLSIHDTALGRVAFCKTIYDGRNLMVFSTPSPALNAGVVFQRRCETPINSCTTSNRISCLGMRVI